MATQTEHPARAVIRTLFAVVVGAAALAPAVYSAATQGDPAAATGWAAAGLAIAGGVTRVMALPAVNRFLQRFVPWLAAEPRRAHTHRGESGVIDTGTAILAAILVLLLLVIAFGLG